MYAYLMTAPGSIERTKIPDPVCQQDEILMSTEAVSICSTDVSYFRGHLFPDAWPIIPGHEYVGRVLEVGTKLRDAVQVGDRVCYWGQTDFGGMADFRALRPIFPGRHGMETSWYTERNFYDADQAAAVVLPDSLSSDLATIIEPLTSVLRSLLLNPPKPGDTCVVLGCGPSALLAVQVLDRYLGAGSVTVLDHNQERLDLARSYGARSAFNTKTEPGTLEDFVHEHHDQFADYVFDALPHIGAPRPGQKDIRGSARVRRILKDPTAEPARPHRAGNQNEGGFICACNGYGDRQSRENRRRTTPMAVHGAMSAAVTETAARRKNSGL